MAYPVESTLPADELKVVGEALQAELTDLVDLSLVAKQIHWNVTGPRFRSVHLQLDEVVETAREYSDTVAERAAALGVSPDGRSKTVAIGSGIRTVPEGWLADSDAVQAMVTALTECVSGARGRMREVGPVDPVTEDVFISLIGELEKHHWMFQAANQG
ncbi:Dps family protein [Streptomyces xiaopingdaonensis]|uniref:Dps family protein n=1 Tax=Streptomyces xiaopingdaonensis TaxID=1565415 RepID=UPI00030169D3|nr:DNA starvation/stationary phase protection protein [Streptomyces xiaopingdaonensis]